jgi:long-chain acyl-CoA synthetase
MRTMYDSAEDQFLHDLILNSCQRFGSRTAIVDVSAGERITYADYGARVEQAAKGLAATGLKVGERVAIALPNCWEFCVAYHATTLAGGVPTLLNPDFREREVRYQLEKSGAAFLITDANVVENMDLKGLPDLRQVFATRTPVDGMKPFSSLLRQATARVPQPIGLPESTLAALPYSSGTEGLPKGVMLSHYNLVANVYQLLVSMTKPTIRPDDVVLCALPLYHIYGLNVVLNPTLTAGGSVVLMPRFDVAKATELMAGEQITILPVVPPMLNAFCQAASQGMFPREHRVKWVKCGAAPLAPALARRFTALTGIPIRQGYGMTEAAPVTHMGFLEADMYRPESIGMPLAATECMVLNEQGWMARPGDAGELVMRGPQFMMGYWKSPEQTAAVLRDGWYWSGDLVRCDRNGFYYVLDRLRDMIKCKGFSVAPAEIEAVLLEHPAVRDCGVAGRPDTENGEVPCAFVVLREGVAKSEKTRAELREWVSEQLTRYKQPSTIDFVEVIPRSPSGKILRRYLGFATSKAA